MENKKIIELLENEKININNIINNNNDISKNNKITAIIMVNKYVENIKNKLSTNNMRCCSECKKLINEGYVINDGLEYYCSDKCLHKHYTKKEWEELYNDTISSSYWTTWENE